MKLLLLNTYDKSGGAAIATYRHHRSLINQSINSKLLVQKKVTDDSSVYIVSDGYWGKIISLVRDYFDGLFLKLYKNRKKVILINE